MSEQVILAGHFQATGTRFAATDGPILVLHDTTEFSYARSDVLAIGQTHKVASGQMDKQGRQRMHAVCGILLHSSLAVTTEGLPLGLAAIRLWTRKKFKGTNALKGRGSDGGKHTVSMTRVPIEEKESMRWLENMRQSTANLDDAGRCIHIGDRESDIFELFCLARREQTHFLVRTCVDRVAGTGNTTISRKMKREPIQGTHQLEVLDANVRPTQVELQVRYCRMTVHPPRGKHTQYPPLLLTVIHA